MLRYIAHGQRSYGDRKILAYARSVWEFEAVIEGRCAPLLPLRTPVPQERCLWVFPPGVVHGWTAAPGTTCTVVVFHVPTVPEPLRSLALAAGPGGLEVSIDQSMADRMVTMWREIAPHLTAPDALTPLRCDHLVCDLSLQVLDALPEMHLPQPFARPQEVVESCLTWYGDHLPEGPEVREVAHAAHVSVAHLRRLFHLVLRKSPQDAFTEIRLRRADDLLRDPNLTLDAIAQACGFTCASTFSRAFRQIRGEPPSRWR